MNMEDLAKPVSILHMVTTLLTFLPVCILNPMVLYEEGIGSEALDATPELPKMALRHMSFLCGYLYLIMAAIVVCLVYSHDSPRLGMSIIVTFWAFNIVCQLLHPWPNADGGAVLTLVGIPFSGTFPFIILWTVLGGVAYLTSPHDLARRNKKKAKSD
jgi:hypothetical protein